MSKFAFFWLCCAMVTGALLFQTSQHVTDGRQRLENITAQMRSEEDSLRVLQAEWSYLNQPDRLEKLARQYLNLTPMKGRQFMAAADLPQRAPEEINADIIAAAAQTAPAAGNAMPLIAAINTAAPESIAADSAPDTAENNANVLDSTDSAPADAVALSALTAADTESAAPVSVMIPLRKPAHLRVPAAYAAAPKPAATAPAAVTTTPKPAAAVTAQPVAAKTPVTATATQRNFGDVLNSLGGVDLP